jgi:glutathione-specific gamma-glutamylcyclotransferase
LVEVLVSRAAAPGDLWIFGYGSLMWRPDFPFVERRPALLTGYHRCFCIVSTHHRGSPERPGLVLGLDRGGACEGVAYRVAADDAARVLAYLRKRELVNGVYREVSAPVRLLDSERAGAQAKSRYESRYESRAVVLAISYIVERCHPSYARAQPLSRQAFMIRGARGLSGNNLDYLVNTVRHLQLAGIRERSLERLVALAGPHVAQMIALQASERLVSPSAAGIRRAVVRQPLAIRRLAKGQRQRFLYRLRLAGG